MGLKRDIPRGVCTPLGMSIIPPDGKLQPPVADGLALFREGREGKASGGDAMDLPACQV